jgi:hypothetical protein
LKEVPSIYSEKKISVEKLFSGGSSSGSVASSSEQE